MSALIGNLTNIKTGKLDANAASSDGKYPFFTCAQEPLAIDRYAYDCDAILVAGNGDLNVKHYKGKFEAYQRTYIIQVADESKLDSRYLYYFMSKYVDKLRELSIGGVIKYIKLGMLTDAEIPLPPLAEQKRIAAILDKADAIRRKRQAAIKLADDFLRATFLDMFGDPVTNPKGWDVKPLEKLVTFRTGKLDSNAATLGGRYPFFTCSRENFQIDTYAFDCEALLLAGNNAAGEYSVKYYKGKFNAYQRTYVLTINEDKLSYRYLQQALEMKLQDLKRMSKGTNTKYLTLGILHGLPFQIPSKSALLSYGKLVDIFENNKITLRNFEQLAAANFNSLTQRAFRGEL